MTAFAADLARFVELAEGQTRDAFVHATEEVKRSVVDGSELTGAPGQKVDTGYMKGSFIGEFVTETLWRLTTNVAYAPVHEYGDRDAFDKEGVERPEYLKSTKEPGAGGAVASTVGGEHSVAHTIAGWPRILEYVTRPGTQREARA